MGEIDEYDWGLTPEQKAQFAISVSVMMPIELIEKGLAGK